MKSTGFILHFALILSMVFSQSSLATEKFWKAEVQEEITEFQNKANEKLATAKRLKNYGATGVGATLGALMMFNSHRAKSPKKTTWVTVAGFGITFSSLLVALRLEQQLKNEPPKVPMNFGLDMAKTLMLGEDLNSFYVELVDLFAYPQAVLDDKALLPSYARAFELLGKAMLVDADVNETLNKVCDTFVIDVIQATALEYNRNFSDAIVEQHYRYCHKTLERHFVE